MSYENIEKVSNELFRPSANFVLKHNIKVASKNTQTGKREYAHSEYTYLANTYADKKYLKSIKLRYNSFLTLEELGKDWTDKTSVLITQSTLPVIRKTLKHVHKWFYKKKYDSLYYYNDRRRLQIDLEFKELQEIVTIGQHTLVFKPAVIELHDEEYEGVNMYINKTDVVARMTIDSFEAFYYIIKHFDLYLAGTTLMAYLGRPEFDKFNMDINTKGYVREESYSESQGNVANKVDDKLKGFFK